MQLIHLKDVVIPENRFRRDFDRQQLIELAASIAGPTGLHHAIRLRDDRKTLIAGERRLKAITMLTADGKRFSHNGEVVPVGMVPFTCASQLTPLELREAEYEENVIRTDFTWLERAEALAGLHQLRTEQAVARGDTQTFRATASEVAGREAEGSQITKVRNAILLNEFKHDPEVAGAKSEKEAFNIVKRKLTDKFTAALARNVKAEAKATPHVALHGDLRALLATLETASFDVLLTDPPYGIDADTFTATDGAETGLRHDYKDTHEYARELMRTILEASTVVCKPDAALYMFCDYPDFEWLQGLANKLGWTAWDRPIFWYKPGGGMMGDTAHGPRRSYETIMYAYRGNKRTTGTFLDVIEFQPRNPEGHAAAKPVEVYVNLLKRSTVPGMTVLDTCMGRGTIFPAANQLLLRATGIEIGEAHYNAALTRIAAKE